MLAGQGGNGDVPEEAQHIDGVERGQIVFALHADATQVHRCLAEPVAGCFDGVPADVPACYEGVASTDQKLAALAEVNYVRELSGLPAVGYDHDSDLQTQQSALMTVANAELEHTPPESWQCWSQTGYDGSASSNLYISYAFGPDAETSPGGVVDAFLIDTGVPSLGHRRWVLDPFLSTVSYGSALGAPLVPSDWAYVHGASLKVINGADADISGLDLEDYVAYPVGSYPSDLIAKDWYHSFMALPSTASRYANANVDYGNVDVRVSAPGGTFMTVHSVSGDNLGYGLPNHLQFIVDGLQDGVTYTVEVSDVVVDGDARTYQYQFTLE